jgi:hypothetical protein
MQASRSLAIPYLDSTALDNISDYIYLNHINYLAYLLTSNIIHYVN